MTFGKLISKQKWAEVVGKCSAALLFGCDINTSPVISCGPAYIAVEFIEA